jgi:HSP20 family protein
VKASYDAGVLSIQLDKRAEAKPKQIKVSVGGAQSLQAVKKEVAA